MLWCAHISKLFLTFLRYVIFSGPEQACLLRLFLSGISETYRTVSSLLAVIGALPPLYNDFSIFCRNQVHCGMYFVGMYCGLALWCPVAMGRCACCGAPKAGGCSFAWPFEGFEGAYGLHPKSRAQRARASSSEVYPAGKLLWRFTCDFDFRRNLWLPFVDGFAALRGFLIVPVVTMGSF